MSVISSKGTPDRDYIIEFDVYQRRDEGMRNSRA